MGMCGFWGRRVWRRCVPTTHERKLVRVCLDGACQLPSQASTVPGCIFGQHGVAACSAIKHNCSIRHLRLRLLKSHPACTFASYCAPAMQ